MSGARLPQTTGSYILASGNVALVGPVDITDPAHLPCGGDSEPGEWGEAFVIVDPGEERLLRDFTADDGYPRLRIDPPIVEFEPDAGDVLHLNVQYTGPLAA